MHLHRRYRILAVVAVAAAAAGPAVAVELACSGPRLTLAVDVDVTAGTCVVDGQAATLRKPANPVVCHVSDPQLRILTIAQDGSFIWEDTDSDRVVRGTCAEP